VGIGPADVVCAALHNARHLEPHGRPQGPPPHPGGPGGHPGELNLLPVSQRIDGIIFDAFASNPDINRGYPYQDITAPTLVIHAKDDSGPPYQAAVAVAAKIPGARLVTVERGGHLRLGNHPEPQAEVDALLRRTATP